MSNNHNLSPENTSGELTPEQRRLLRLDDSLEGARAQLEARYTGTAGNSIPGVHRFRGFDESNPPQLPNPENEPILPALSPFPS
jgi:hypothetical protein